jgi:hypothetical protein
LNLKNDRRELKPENFWNTAYKWTWKKGRKNRNLLGSPDAQLTNEIEIVRRQLQSEVQLQLTLAAWVSWWILPIAKNIQRSKKQLQGERKWRKKRQEEETQAQTVLTLGVDQITKLWWAPWWDGFLSEVNVKWSNSECVETG